MDDHPADLEQPWHAPPDQAALRARAYNLRWAETDDDVIPLTAADPDLPTAEVVTAAIRDYVDAPHLCYCHSPARYLWEQTADYAQGRGGLVRRLGLGLFGEPLRRWDRRTASRVTRFLANSRHTAARIERRISILLGVPVLE